LPEQQIIDVPFKLSDTEKELYNQIRMRLLFEIERLAINKVENITTLDMGVVNMLRLRQLIDSTELLGEKTESSKLEVLKELLLELKDNKIIIFTEFAKMAVILQREIGGLMISGKETNKAIRMEVVNKFNTDPNERIILMTAAGMYGLNIFSANTIIHYDQVWSLGKQIQRNGRIAGHRQMQRADQRMLIYNLLAKGSVDEYMQKKLAGKQKISDQVMGENLDKLPTLDEAREMLTIVPE
jgi:SNF2 family DNA or RNA helicase